MTTPEFIAAAFLEDVGSGDYSTLASISAGKVHKFSDQFRFKTAFFVGKWGLYFETKYTVFTVPQRVFHMIVTLTNVEPGE